MAKNMLIIEDDGVLRDLLRLVFEYDGFRCAEAENGAMGLTMVDSQPFDIIILDNAMPIMSGLEFLKEFQHHSNKPKAPVIMTTGFLNKETREKATKLGAYAILAKPYDLGELRALVAQLCTGQTPSLPKSSLLNK